MLSMKRCHLMKNCLIMNSDLNHVADFLDFGWDFWEFWERFGRALGAPPPSVRPHRFFLQKDLGGLGVF
jgi:hypothetical protein